MGKAILVLVFLLTLIFLISAVKAETTFFDQDDAFIMGNSQTTPTTSGGVTGEATSGRSCRYEWNCASWSECLSSGKQTRNCTNTGTCSDRYETPELKQNCTDTFSPKVENEVKGLETEKITGRESIDNNKISLYFIAALIVGFVIFYWKKDYFKRLIKRQ